MVIFELPEIMDSDPVDMFVLYYNILISMKGQLNVNTLWLGMDLLMAIHFMSQRQDYVIVNFLLEFGRRVTEKH